MNYTKRKMEEYYQTQQRHAPLAETSIYDIVPTGAWWDDIISQAKGTFTAPKDQGKNFLDIYRDLKIRLAQQLGVYKKEDGSIAYIQAMTAPVLTPVQGDALFQAWNAVGNDLIAQLLKAGRWGLMGQLVKYRDRYTMRRSEWWSDNLQRYKGQLFKGKYMFMPQTYELLTNVIGRYVIEINSIAWSQANIETAYQMILSSLDETPGGWLLKPAFQAGWYGGMIVEAAPDFARRAATDMIYAASATWRYTKYAMYAGAAYVLWSALGSPGLKPKKGSR